MLYDIEKFNKRNELNPGFWDQFTNRDLLEGFPMRARREILPAVNVMENDKEFIVELAAPGMCKDNYKLEVENDILTISGNAETQNDEDTKKYTRREFSSASFDRSFMLPDYVKQDEIAASCADGILTIHIPTEDEARIQHKREIDIS